MFKIFSAMIAGVAIVGATVSGGEDPQALTERVLSSPDPQAAFEGLTPEQAQEFLEFNSPVKVSVSEDVQPVTPPAYYVAGTKCWNAWRDAEARSAANIKIYEWWQGLEWCGKDKKIVSKKVFDRGGHTKFPGSNYRGPADSGSRNVGWEIRQYTQEEFEFGIKGYGSTINPCIQIRGGATGLYSARVDCRLN